MTSQVLQAEFRIEQGDKYESDINDQEEEDKNEIVEIIDDSIEELQSVKDETIALREEEACEFANEVDENQLEELPSVKNENNI